jgi:hypothetical protein
LSELKAVDEQPKLIHPDIISEIPGVETEDMYDGIIGPVPIGEEEKPPSYAERAARARKNAGLDAIDQARGVNDKQDEVIVIDDDKDDAGEPLVRGVSIKEDQVDRLSVGGVYESPRQEMVDENTSDPSEDEEESLGQGKRKIIPLK